MIERSAADKIGIRPDEPVRLIGAPAGWAPAGLPPGARLLRRADSAREPARVTIAFVRDLAAAHRVLPAAVTALPRGGMLWVAWPRRAGGHESDITDNRLREIVLPLGPVDVKIAALDLDWSGMKFVHRIAPRR